jgi:hypothetical protein
MAGIESFSDRAIDAKAESGNSKLDAGKLGTEKSSWEPSGEREVINNTGLTL